MAKLFAASGMYAIPEILCIKGTRWHEVIQEKKSKKKIIIKECHNMTICKRGNLG